MQNAVPGGNVRLTDGKYFWTFLWQPIIIGYGICSNAIARKNFIIDEITNAGGQSLWR